MYIYTEMCQYQDILYQIEKQKQREKKKAKNYLQWDFTVKGSWSTTDTAGREVRGSQVRGHRLRLAVPFLTPF
uniref:Uncharacterized protein n=1 Tax=Anguilla anguilla TaxID=7936 RepID=A0A0E9XMW5_ANGAN